MPLGKDQLKQIFVDEAGILKTEEFDAIVKVAGQNRQHLEQTLMERGFVAPHHFLSLLASHYKVPSVDLKINDVDQAILELLPEKFASSHLVVPFAKEEDTIRVAMADPSDTETLRNLGSALNATIEPYVATEHAIKRALVLYRGSMKDVLTELLERIKNEKNPGENNPSVQALVQAILETSILMEASDIHIEPYETETIVRFRVDGLLKSMAILPAVLHHFVIARLKVLSGMKIDEKRLPQDGRFSIKIQEEEVNLRVSSVPSMWGEKVVMRVLRKDTQLFDLGSIGLLDSDLEIIRKHLKNPFGMVLVCGPTGSGKTSTLYAFLQEIGLERIDIVNISTIEDPIEYTMQRVTQIQIHPEINLTFASGLRSLLRQDPDIIMVGEIRDKETADIAVRAALVGRLLLSSLHTNDAVGAIPRLIDMEVEPYLVSSTLSLAVAQRLVRKLCQSCRESYKLDAAQIELLKNTHGLDNALQVLGKRGIISNTSDISDLRFYKSKGCEKCDQSGYIGRTAIFEILEVTDELKTLITNSADSVRLKDAAVNEGMKTMFADGLAKVILGVTDLDELLRVAI